MTMEIIIQTTTAPLSNNLSPTLPLKFPCIALVKMKIPQFNTAAVTKKKDKSKVNTIVWSRT